MPWFDNDVTRKSETDDADACGSCVHDQCMCPCSVCRAHASNPNATVCGCVSCAQLRQVTKPIRPILREMEAVAPGGIQPFHIDMVCESVVVKPRGESEER